MRRSSTVKTGKGKRTADIRRRAKRTANEQIAQHAEITDREAFDALGLIIGTSHDGQIIMSRSDWLRVKNCIRIADVDKDDV